MKKQIEAEGGRFLIMGGISDSVDQAAVLPAFHFDTGNIPYPAKNQAKLHRFIAKERGFSTTGGASRTPIRCRCQ